MLYRLRELFFPKRCLGCGKWGEFLCEGCFQALPFLEKQLCAYCGKPALGGATHDPSCTHYPNGVPRRFYLDGVLSALSYEGLVRKLIGRFKYYPQVEGLWEVIAGVFYRCLGMEKGYFPNSTVVTAVPLHRRRLRERGFNQAQLIAQILAELWGLESNFHLLVRHRFTRVQRELRRSERFTNVRGAFLIKDKEWFRVRPLPWVVLVDDVWTTGATLKECGRVLKRAGVSKVWAVTLARD